MITGAHEGIGGGLHLALERAMADGCGAVQIFTKNASQWREPELPQEKIAAFHLAHAATGNIPVLAHTSYLVNLGSADDALLTRSKDALVAEVERSSALGVAFVVLHPGTHNGAGVEEGIARVVAALVEVLDRTKRASARILLENTAGQGTCLGCSFEELAAIFEGLERASSEDVAARMGVCFDTQHAFASGYDLAQDAGYDETFRRFAGEVGLGRLKAFHLNDSKKPLGSRVDRHEHIGEGNLGLPTFWRLANDARFALLPGVVETAPREGDFPYRDEVRLLRRLEGKAKPKPKAGRVRPADVPQAASGPRAGKRPTKR